MTTKKTKDSSQKTIKITFSPLNSAAMEKVVLLKKTSIQLVNGVQQSVIEDLIEGLPQVFSVKKDEIVEVTPEQFKQLYQLGFVETEAEREARINEEKGKIESIMYDKLNRARIKSLEIKKLESKISALSNSEY